MKSSTKQTKGKKQKLIGNDQTPTREQYEALSRAGRIQLIKKLIPMGLMAVSEELQREIDEITRASGSSVRRYGSNPGSVILGNQRVPIKVPRLRAETKEIPLESYQMLHQENDSSSLFKSILQGLSCRDYGSIIEPQEGAISKSRSTISRRFIKVSAEQLKQLHVRDLSCHDFAAIFLDGTAFSKEQMIIALGVTLEGKKIVLGFTESSTENGRSVSLFLSSLLDRGLCIDQGLLAITDGSKGFLSALYKSFPKRVIIQRCQWHKRENVVSYLAKKEQSEMRSRLQLAYSRPTYEESSKILDRIFSDLDDCNQSASASLQEGLEETLTLHRLGVYGVLGTSLKTTNCIESLNASVKKYCDKVDYWKNSDQRQRWLACALLEIEPRLNRIRGSNHMSKLRDAVKRELKL